MHNLHALSGICAFSWILGFSVERQREVPGASRVGLGAKYYGQWLDRGYLENAPRCLYNGKRRPSDVELLATPPALSCLYMEIGNRMDYPDYQDQPNIYAGSSRPGYVHVVHAPSPVAPPSIPANHAENDLCNPLRLQGVQ